MAAGNKDIMGVMIESNLVAGRQDIPPQGPSGLKYGQVKIEVMMDADVGCGDGVESIMVVAISEYGILPEHHGCMCIMGGHCEHVGHTCPSSSSKKSFCASTTITTLVNTLFVTTASILLKVTEKTNVELI